jgi:hypothetical protein
MLTVSDRVAIPERELEERFVRAPARAGRT